MASENGGAVRQPEGGSPPYRGLLVDWGGVMTTDVFEAFRAFCEREGLEPDTLRRRFREDPSSRDLLIALETGQLDEDEFEPRFAEVLGVDAPGLIERIFSGAGPDEEMMVAVERARGQGVKTGLISNSWGTRRYDRELLGRLFDGVVISGEVGIRKPSREIYEMATQKIGLPPRECVFVDDLPFNLKPAAELGMATVHHSASEQTIPELEKLLAVELR
jgi:epoxide hydrolase-like predicted phosphatase